MPPNVSECLHCDGRGKPHGKLLLTAHLSQDMVKNGRLTGTLSLCFCSVPVSLQPVVAIAAKERANHRVGIRLKLE